MRTACGCLANAEQTQILTPCQWHDQWAKARYGVRPPPLVVTRPTEPLDAYGPAMGDARGKSTTR